MSSDSKDSGFDSDISISRGEISEVSKSDGIGGDGISKPGGIGGGDGISKPGGIGGGDGISKPGGGGGAGIPERILSIEF